MTPKRILLVRHAESEANIDHSLYFTKPDWKIKLSENGIEQSKLLGSKIKSLIFNPVVYCSSYVRAKQTARVAGLNTNIIYDPRLRERDWSSLITSRSTEVDTKMIYEFYYRFPGGESAADVYDRVSNFLFELFTCNTHNEIVIISHGAAVLVSLIKLLRLDPDKYGSMSLPDNCEIFELLLSGSTYNIQHQYKLDEY